MGTDVLTENIETSIESCRTCGTYFLTSSNLLRQMFTTPSDDADMEQIRSQLNAWDVPVDENDSFTKFICIGCIHEFQKIFKFRSTCVSTQKNFNYFRNMRQENIKIKTEIPDPEEEIEKELGFIYVDDLSGDEDTANSSFYFNFTHIPIKLEKSDDVENCIFNLPNGLETNASPIKDQNDKVSNDLKCPPTEKELTFPLERIKKEKISSEIANEEETNNVIKCNFCSYSSSCDNSMVNHIQLYHETKDHECHICGKKFSKSTFMRFKYHLKWHKISKHIKCPQCGFYCASKQILSEHRRAVHAKVPCEKCGKCFTLKKLKIHLRNHEMENEPNTSEFYDPPNIQEDLQQPLWDNFNNDELPQTENIANQALETETFVVLCAKCNAAFDSTIELENHIHLDHSTINESSLDKINITAKDINNISPRKTEETPESESTDTASETVSEENDLSSTNSIYTYQCSDCYEMFKTVAELQEHHITHMQIRPRFECSICNKSFELKFSLNRHLKKHKNLSL